MNFKSVIQGRRKQLKISQTEMAKSMSISRRVYQRIEAGNGNVDETAEVMRRLNIVAIYIPKEMLDSTIGE